MACLHHRTPPPRCSWENALMMEACAQKNCRGGENARLVLKFLSMDNCYEYTWWWFLCLRLAIMLQTASPQVCELEKNWNRRLLWFNCVGTVLIKKYSQTIWGIEKQIGEVVVIKIWCFKLVTAQVVGSYVTWEVTGICSCVVLINQVVSGIHLYIIRVLCQKMFYS